MSLHSVKACIHWRKTVVLALLEKTNLNNNNNQRAASLGEDVDLGWRREWKWNWSQQKGIWTCLQYVTFRNAGIGLIWTWKPTEILRWEIMSSVFLHNSHRKHFFSICNRVDKEGTTCTFCDCAAGTDCNSSSRTVRDQIVIDTHNENSITESTNSQLVRTNNIST